MQIDTMTILLLILNFGISIWNAYTAGYNIGIIRKYGGNALAKIGSYSILGLAFSGMAYVMGVVVSYVAAYFNYASPNVVAYVLSFNFIVFGFLSIAFGLVVAIRSIMDAARNRDLTSIGLAIWNTVMEILNISTYLNGFDQAKSSLNLNNEQEKQNSYALIIIAVLIAFFLTYGVYKHGLNKAQSA